MSARNILTFHKYDYDGSGQLDRAEFAIALHDLGYPVPRPEESDQWSPLWFALGNQHGCFFFRPQKVLVFLLVCL